MTYTYAEHEYRPNGVLSSLLSINHRGPENRTEVPFSNFEQRLIADHQTNYLNPFSELGPSVQRVMKKMSRNGEVIAYNSEESREREFFYRCFSVGLGYSCFPTQEEDPNYFFVPDRRELVKREATIPLLLTVSTGGFLSVLGVVLS